MNILVGCEYSGIVRDAFIRRGHNAVSCDILPSESDFGPHLQCDVRDVLDWGWDMAILHPPCTDMSSCNAQWLAPKLADGRMEAAWAFALELWWSDIPKIAMENPVGTMWRVCGKATQYVEPWQFGHPWSKKTGLWLKGLPPLIPTDIVPSQGTYPGFYLSKSATRGQERSRFWTGMADAMADQWG